MVIEQIRIGTDNFSYLIYDEEELVGVLVDPGYDASVPLKRISDLGLDLKYVIATHHHGDHVHDVPRVIKETGARSAAFKDADIDMKDGDELKVGNIDLKIIHTPGHTPDSICIVVDDEHLVTGDTLFIGDCGRCDLPGGSLEDMFVSLQGLKDLSDPLLVCPGHDYGDKVKDSLGNQKRISKVLLAKNLGEFSGIDQ